MRSARRIARCGLITSVYLVLCLLLAPLSFGAVQVRVSEALTLLPLLCPDAVVGVTLGCFLANFFASSPVDAVFGTAATLCAALCTLWVGRRRPRGLYLWAALPPIVINALVVGAEITFLFASAPATLPLFWTNALFVALGQAVSCGVLGIALVRFISRTPSLLAYFQT